MHMILNALFFLYAFENALADAIKNIKSMYGVTRNWQGDPCAPTAFSWDGLNCSYNAYI